MHTVIIRPNRLRVAENVANGIGNRLGPDSAAPMRGNLSSVIDRAILFTCIWVHLQATINLTCRELSATPHDELDRPSPRSRIGLRARSRRPLYAWPARIGASAAATPDSTAAGPGGR